MAESKELTVSPADDEQTPPPADDSAEPPAPDAPASYRLRRAPRYRAFGFTGVFVGVIVGVVLALSFTAAGDYSARTILGYFMAIFGLVGALLGAGVAVLLDRRKD